MNQQKICKIIMLCGYLGSGKTTLIEYIIKKQNKYKVAIIQNEFSDEMGIEAPLMKDSQGDIFEKYYELPNGCICCSAKTDLMIAIEYLITQENSQLDYLMIETNGLADPSATIKLFWVDENLKWPAELKTIQAIVPAHRFAQLENDEIFIRQLMFADNIFLNHIDKLENEEDIQYLEHRVQVINPLASIKRTSFCNIDIDTLFQSFEISEKQKFTSILNQISDHAHIDKEINYIQIQFDEKQPFNLKKLELSLGNLLWEPMDENIQVMRMKGIIYIENDEYAYSLQGVEEVFEIRKTDTKWTEFKTTTKNSKILFIGKGLSQYTLKQYLNI